MKKINLILNVVLSALVLTGTVFFIINNDLVSEILTAVAICLLAGVNLFFAVMKKKNILMVSILSGGVLLFVVAGILFEIVPLLGIILFIFANIAIVATMIILNGVSFRDLSISLCVFIPELLLILLSPNFGAVATAKGVFGVILALSLALVVAKCISAVMTKKNCFSGLLSLAVSILIVSNMFVMFKIYAYVPHVFGFIYRGLINVASMLLSVSLCAFIETDASAYKIEKTGSFVARFKENLTSVVSIALVSVLSVTGLAFSFSNFNLINPRMAKDEFLSAVGSSLEIPLVEINTENSKEPQNKVDYVNCSFKISNCDNPDYNFSVDMADEFDNEEDGVDSVGVRLRGNSTINMVKKPYRIKFEEKKAMLGLKKNKSWVLLADYIDQSNIRNFTAHTLASYLDGLDFAITPNHVALIFNGEFRGLYLLCEQVDENSGRTDVKDNDIIEDEESVAGGAYSSTITDFPFLVEMNEFETSIPGDVSPKDIIYIDGLEEIEIKYPENDERIIESNGTDKIKDYITTYLSAVWSSLKNGSAEYNGETVYFEDLVDIDSFVDYWLLNEIMRNPDACKKSVYMYKSTNGKLKFGPAWDFDWSMTNEWTSGTYNKSHIESAQGLQLVKSSQFFREFLKTESNYNIVASRFNEIKASILTVAEELKTYKAKIDAVALIDAKMWYGKNGEFQYDMQYDYVRLFLLDRYTYLDYAFNLSFEEFHNL